MEKIGIVTDEAADLPREIIERYKIAIVQVKLDWPELESLPGENTFQKMRELGKRGIKSFGKTSQPSPKDFLDKYNYQLERFDKIICVTITSKLSGTYNSAIQAKNFLTLENQKRVFIIDSLSASCGQAIIVLKAIDLIENNRGIEEITEELEKFVPQVLFFAMLETPKWLEASGRISHLVANLLRRMAQVGIRPLLAFKKGLLVPAGLKADAKDIPTALFKQFEAKTRELRKEGKRFRAVITHGDDPGGAQRLKEMIENEFKNTEVAFLNIINNIVGAVTGPNTLVLAWCEI
jgi:DegV family protein with EDD domain